MNRIQKIIISIVCICALAGAGWFAFEKWNESKISAVFPGGGDVSSSQELPPVDTTPRTPPSGQLEYRNTHYRFSLFYPGELSYKEYDEGNGAGTVTFENADDSLGFQIFIVPYDKTQIDLARFKLDEPSGVIKEATDVTIDGLRGTIFFGNNAIMGDTREVWFIRGGYLFEVTSYKDLDAWLSQIMSSWKFI